MPGRSDQHTGEAPDGPVQNPPDAPGAGRTRPLEALENAAAVTGRLAHDFGNFLTGILGFAELAATQVQRDSQAELYVREVVNSARQAAAWTQRLRLLSRRHAGPFTPAGLATVVAEEEGRLRPRWAPGVVLHVAVPAGLPPLAVDADSLRQVLAELLDNAREAIPRQGVVTLAARRVDLTEADCADLIGAAVPGQHVEVTVTDTGTGIAPEVRRRLFVEPFCTTKVRHRGLGLGVVHGILQTFRGGLRLGPDPERGAAVKVYLPVAAEAAAPGAVRGPRLLVVEDDPLLLGYMATALQTAGYRVEVAASGAEALAVHGAAAEPFALVLSDVMMPHMSGFELGRRLRRLDPGVNLLFMSGDATELAREPGLGQFGLLSKPFRPEALLQAVRAALQRPAAAATQGE
jgi:CheY-like chemotaxis protein